VDTLDYIGYCIYDYMYDSGRGLIMNKAVKGIQTVNRFIKLLNSMPEKARQNFYRKMAAKIEEDKLGLRKYHVHIYEISGKVELDVFTFSEEGAKSGALEAAKRDAFIFGESDCKHIAIAFLIEKDKK